MEYKATVIENALSEVDIDFWTKAKRRQGLTATEDVLVLTPNPRVPGVNGSNYIVYTGPYTPPYTVRDCGDHYIMAGRDCDSFARIDKATMKITWDVPDDE